MIDSTGKETTEFYPIEAHNVTNFIKVTEASIKDSYASVAGTSGNDSISIYNNYVILVSGSGNDSIFTNSNTKEISILAGAGNDNIVVQGNDSSIYAGNGNDRIFVATRNNVLAFSNKVYCGDGSDTVAVIESMYNTLSSEQGTDFISIQENSAWNTIVGGTVEDTILLVNSDYSCIMFGLNDGHDTLVGIDDNDTIWLDINSENETYTAETIDNDVIVKLYKSSASNEYSSITLKDAVGKNLNIRVITSEDIFGDFNKFWINSSLSTYNTINNITIYGGAGDDSICNYGSSVSIDGSKGDDSIFSYGSNVSIDGGNGDNTINGGNGTKYVSAGFGDDNVTLG